MIYWTGRVYNYYLPPMQFAMSPEAVRRGRPADAAKRAAILAAAQHLFTSGGYTATRWTRSRCAPGYRS